MGTAKRTKKDRRFNGTSRNRPDRKKERQAEATGTEPGNEGRNVLYARLTTQQKLDRLPPEPLCKRQRARLTALLEGKAKAKAEPQVESKEEVQ